MLECKQSEILQFFNTRANNSGGSGPITPKIELIRDLIHFDQVCADSLIFVDASVNKVTYSYFFKSRANNSRCSGPIRSIIELI